MTRQIIIGDYLPLLYRQELERLAQVDDNPIQYALHDGKEYFTDLLNRVHTDYLLNCYQEGLLMVSELRFFLGITNTVESIVGGESPFMAVVA